MNETLKTLIFLAVSGAITGAALLNYSQNQPRQNEQYALAGKPFFEDFESSADAKALEVVTVNPETMELQKFSVQNIDGTWRIPSHHNYPAEAADRLAETAASAIGITRAAVAGKSSDFARMGVVDPLDMDSAKVDDATAFGQRFTLRDADGEPLVDLIIGKPAGEAERVELDPTAAAGAEPAQYFYVRRPDEKLVYKATIDLKLSTRFSDWIDPDLLRIDSGKIRRVSVDNYELKEQSGGFLGQVKTLFKEQGDQIQLSRKSFTDPWEFPSLNVEREELNSTRIQSTLEILSELAIAGVRPKFKYNDQLLLTPDLKFNPALQLEKDVEQVQAAVEQFQDELEDRGFSFAGTQEKLELASANGQLQVGTDEGVLYSLHIGRPLEGTDQEIEVGGAKSVDDLNTDDEKEKIANYQEGEKNRYLMVNVSFDESLLGEKPTQPKAPVEPAKPDGYTPASAEDAKTDEANPEAESEPKSETEPRENSEQDADQAEPKSDEPESKRDIAFEAYDEAMSQYEQQKIEFELASTRYDEELKEFEEKIVAGKKLVDELNQRFGDWYYVIRGSNLRTLQLKRSDVVQARADLEPSAPPANPSLPNFSQPILGDSDQPEMKFDPAEIPEADDPTNTGEGQPAPQPDAETAPATSEAEKKPGQSSPQENSTSESAPDVSDASKPKSDEPASEPKSNEPASEPKPDQPASEPKPDQPASEPKSDKPGGDKDQG